jgi:hypothetical protein
MSNPLSNIWKGLVSFFTSPGAEAVEKEVAQAALPVAETALTGLAKSNPAVNIAITILEPVINKEITKGNTP